MQSQTSVFLRIPFVRPKNLILSDCDIATHLNSDSPWRSYQAIWDTGANVCALSPRVISECGLTPECKPLSIAHADARGKEVHAFRISLKLPNGIEFHNVLAGEKQSDDIDVLIGMNVIGRGDLLVMGDAGRAEALFRFPAVNDSGVGMVFPRTKSNPKRP